MTYYVPGLGEKDPDKTIRSLMQAHEKTATNTTSIATNTSDIAALTAVVATKGTGTVTNVATAGLATGGAITTTGTVTVTAAVQSDQETGTSTAVAVVPGVQKYHPGHPKAWALVTQSAGSYTLAAAFGISSINKTGTGVVEVTVSTAFSSTSYGAIVSPTGSSQILNTSSNINSATKVTVSIIRSSTEALTDGGFSILFFGDQ